MPRRAARHHHHVYVVELSDRVWNEPSFRKANPDYRLGQPFVYVGMTGLDPDVRFDNHLRGHKGCPLVRIYGVRLRPDLYADFPAMTWEDALATEVAWAQELRELRYAVYQH